MRVVYFGTADFAVPALRAISPFVSLVVSQPDRPKGRGLKLQASPVKLLAEELGLPVETPEKSRSPEFVDRLKVEQADVFMVAAYGQILSQAVLDVPHVGCINLHGSILPKWRGAAPIQRAIEAGDRESGVTLMHMDRGMDTGDIIAIEKVEISPNETSGELYNTLSLLAGNMASNWIERLCRGQYPRMPQDHSQATMAPKIEKAEAEITANLTLKDAYNRFRAFTPIPGAFVSTELGLVKLISVKPANEMSSEPGTIIVRDGLMFITLQEGALQVNELQLEGKRRVSAHDFMNGAHVRSGMRFMR